MYIQTNTTLLLLCFFYSRLYNSLKSWNNGAHYLSLLIFYFLCRIFLITFQSYVSDFYCVSIYFEWFVVDTIFIQAFKSDILYIVFLSQVVDFPSEYKAKLQKPSVRYRQNSIICTEVLYHHTEKEPTYKIKSQMLDCKIMKIWPNFLLQFQMTRILLYIYLLF